jgi:hypothetical protein
MIDLTVVKQVFERQVVDTIGFVRTENNPADVLTKVTRSPNLEKIHQTTKILHPEEQ